MQTLHDISEVIAGCIVYAVWALACMASGAITLGIILAIIDAIAG